MTTAISFTEDCRACPRLAAFLDEVGEQYPGYHARPVSPFGVGRPKILIVGLAPGMHGANATGRPFTGDYAGILLYETLYHFGLSNRAVSENRGDGLKLRHCRITNAVKCLPPQNKPTTPEIKQCNGYLKDELRALAKGTVVVALGGIAHQSVLRALGLKSARYGFGHAHEHDLGQGLTLLDSYHCSRYNTQTKRLTADMFHAVFARACELSGLATPSQKP